MKTITAQQNQTWDMLAKEHLDFEYFTKDIMLLNPQYADVVIFEGGEQINIPDFENDEAEEDDVEVNTNEGTWV